MFRLSNQAEGENSPVLLLFVLLKPFTGWVMPTCQKGEPSLLSSVCQYKYKSLLDTLSQTHPEIVFSQISGYPMAQLIHEISHHKVKGRAILQILRIGK